MSTPFAAPPAHAYYDQTKRAVDCLVAATLLIVGAPLWLAIAVAIKLGSPGPILFTRTVIGRGGRPFTYYKFRTMTHRNDDSAHRAFLHSYVRENKPFAVRHDAATGQEQPIYKVVADPRVTRVGRVLRRTSLDEIPQCINVLRGQMSLIGPRPPIDYEFDLYDDAAKARLAVLPGISGLAQVRGRGRVSFSQMLTYDLAYIRRRSVAYDLTLMVATVKTMLSGQ